MSRLLFITIIILLLTSCGNESHEAGKEQTYSEIKTTEEWLNSLNNDSTIIISSSQYKNLKKSDSFNYAILYRMDDLTNYYEDEKNYDKTPICEDFSNCKRVNVQNEGDSVIVNFYTNIKGYSTLVPHFEITDTTIEIGCWRPKDVRVECYDGKCDTVFLAVATMNILQLQVSFNEKLIANRRIKINGKGLNQYVQYDDYAMRPIKAVKIAQAYVSKKYSNQKYSILPKVIYSINDSCYQFEINELDEFVKVNALTGEAFQRKK